jgi:ribosomal protein S18 acetylase RimI-like enzyme
MDLPALVALNAEVQALHVQALPRRYRAATRAEVEDLFRQRLAQPDTSVLVAEEDAGPVGYAVVSVAEKAGNVLTLPLRAAEVHELGVAARARRLGTGRALMAAAEAQARAWGASEIVLSVIDFNEGARRFYEAIGYETVLRRLARPL